MDLYYLNGRADRFKSGSFRGSKVSIDFDNVQEENIDPYSNSLLMRTGKFSKKTFNFGNV